MPDRNRLLTVLDEELTMTVLRLVWGYRTITTAQLEVLLGPRVTRSVRELQRLGIIRSTDHGDRTIHRICNPADQKRFGRLLGRAARQGVSGEPGLRAEWGKVRHDLLVVESLIELLRTDAAFDPTAVGAEREAARLRTQFTHPYARGRRGRPRGDAALWGSAGGRLLFVEVTASARRSQLVDKFRRWSASLQYLDRRRVVGVLFVNACRSDEWARAERLHHQARDEGWEQWWLRGPAGDPAKNHEVLARFSSDDLRRLARRPSVLGP